MLIAGLAERIEEALDEPEEGRLTENPSNEDLAELIIESANAGVPLTWREVRFLHDRIGEAWEAHRAQPPALYRTFDPATPDGKYPFQPDDAGIAFRSIGSLLGSCASQYRNPVSKPVFDCERLKERHPAGR